MPPRSFSPQQYAAHLLQAATQIVAESTAVVQRGALNVKNEGRRNSTISSGKAAYRAPSAIGFDQVHVTAAGIYADIGYEGSGGQAGLGAILEYGGGRDHSPPHNDLGRALDAEAPRFEAALADAAVRALS